MPSENQMKASPVGTDPIDAVGVLFSYSEWLDGQGLILSDEDPNDSRSHEQLVTDYLIELHEDT